MASDAPASFSGSFRLDNNYPEIPQADAGQSSSSRPTTGSTTQPSYTTSSSKNAAPGTPIHPPYYSYPTWQNTWPNTGGYSYSGTYPPHHQPTPGTFVQYQPQNQRAVAQQPTNPLVTPKAQSPSPSPSPSPPPPETYRYWDGAIMAFLTRLGLTQAAAGLEVDILVMNPVWEQKQVPDALEKLMNDLSSLGKARDSEASDKERSPERPLDERKLDYVHIVNNGELRSQSTINKSISAFLAQNQRRNDASNRSEFVHSLAQKRRRINENTESANVTDVSSCARTDAKTLDRDVQMKYDIAKNEDGPLSRTIKHAPLQTSSKAKGKQKARNMGVGDSSTQSDNDANTPDRYIGLDERLKNIEDHFSIRYVPSPPRTLLDRLKFLEDHIVQLEKEYPPWAALHFNQPNRGWPPPPRSTPIIVPPNLRRPTKDTSQTTKSAPTISAEVKNTGGTKLPRNTNSSLHRAVLERLEVHQAMSDLAGGSGG